MMTKMTLGQMKRSAELSGLALFYGVLSSCAAAGIDVNEAGNIAGGAESVGMTLQVAGAGVDGNASNVDLPRFPAISPDGSEVVFSWRGDLWKCSTEGGAALRLTVHPADELRSTWSIDGREIAFNSTRASGVSNIFVMQADGTNVRPVTEIDRSCIVHSYGVDETGEPVITFHSSLEGDVYRGSRPYMVSVKGGDLRRVHGAFGAVPAVSSDGDRVLFTRGGSSWNRRHYLGPDDRDVWLYDRTTGDFKALTTWEGNDGGARWLDDDRVLFLSDRELNCVNLYVMDVAGGDATAKRLTSFAVDDVQDFDVARDGSRVVLSVWDTLYTLDLNAANAEPTALVMRAIEDAGDQFLLKSIDREVNEAALSPDGEVMAYIAYGEVYVRNVAEKSVTRRVTNSHARERGIAWSPDGLKLYFVSDRDGTNSIYAATVALTRSELKDTFAEAQEPAEVEEEDDDTESEVEDEADQDDEAAEGADEDEDDGGGDEGKSEEDEDDADDEEAELPKELQPKRWHDAVRFNLEAVLVDTTLNDRDPNPSPDGKSLLFRRTRGDLMILDLTSGDLRTVTTGWDAGTSGRWSADSHYIAYDQSDLDFNSDIWIVRADGSAEAVNVTQHPDNDGNPRWSADGKILSFVSERVNEEMDVWMVYLDKDLEALTPLELADYYDEQAKAVKKRKPLAVENPAADDDDDKAEDAEDEDEDEDESEENGADEIAEVPELDLDDAYLRLRRVTRLQGSEFNNELTPAGDRYIFTSTGDESGLFSVKWDGSDQKRLSDSVSVAHLTLTGDKIIYVSGGRAGSISPTGGKTENYDISDQIRIDLQKQAAQKFGEAARVLGEQFYHPEMKGLDWEYLSAKYGALAVQTRTANEFDQVAARFIGELNASHLGIRSRRAAIANTQSLGRLGTTHERVELEIADPDNEGQAKTVAGFEISAIVPQSPAAKGDMALQVGDVITELELAGFSATDTIEARLKGRVGSETIVTIQRRQIDEAGVETRQRLDLLLTPISSGAERGLKYEAWRNENARLVGEWSDGRLGYIHIQGMNQSSLDIFERDLYAAAHGKDGLLIDVRNNGGGWTTDRLLGSIMAMPHAYTIPRGANSADVGHYPQDRLFIQRYALPINMLCNEKSFSNAEIISHAFKAFGRGNLVGEETYGGVISTGGFGLIDGTFVRLPFRGWFLNDGTDMENHGAMPDVLVHQTPEAESRNDDEQLRAAVTDLLSRLR